MTTFRPYPSWWRSRFGALVELLGGVGLAPVAQNDHIAVVLNSRFAHALYAAARILAIVALSALGFGLAAVGLVSRGLAVAALIVVVVTGLQFLYAVPKIVGVGRSLLVRPDAMGRFIVVVGEPEQLEAEGVVLFWSSPYDNRVGVRMEVMAVAIHVNEICAPASDEVQCVGMTWAAYESGLSEGIAERADQVVELHDRSPL